MVDTAGPAATRVRCVLKGFRFFFSMSAAAIILLAVSSGLSAQAAWDDSRSAMNPSARSELDKGVDAYKAARYEEAIAHFRKAAEIDPGAILAKVYLGTALSQNVMPGLDTPENLKVAREAIGEFTQALAVRPHDVNALKQVAALYFNIKEFDDAREWQKKVLDEDPHDSDAAYTIGVIDWTMAHVNALAALQARGLNDDGEGNIEAPADVLETIRVENQQLVEEGLRYLKQAIEDRPDYDDAMAYLNLTYRRKADLDHGDKRAVDEDVTQAREWTAKSMQTRRTREEKRVSAKGANQP